MAITIKSQTTSLVVIWRLLGLFK